jgi:hypothetical protein
MRNSTVRQSSVLPGFRRILPLGVILALVFAPLPLFSQAANGRISGVVRDQTGGSVAGAMVTVTDVARGLSRNLTTDDVGAYLAPNLIPGAYSIRVAYTGFQTWQRDNIALGVGGDLSIDAVLQPGSQTQTVTITEEVPLVNTTNAVLGGALSNDTIVDLPLNGRNYQNLLNLRPGTIVNPGGNERQSTNGLRGTENVYLVEGLSNDEPYTGLSMLNAPIQAGDVAILLPVDSIQEIGNSANNKAEYGLKPGGVVNVGIKTGTNAIHGSAFAFGRKDSFAAKNWFSNSGYGGCTNPDASGQCPVLPLGLEQWGLTGGGPIKKDKLFWFGAFEEQRYSVVAPQPAATPIVCGGGTPGCGLTAPNVQTSFTDALDSLVKGGTTIGPTAGTNIALNSLIIAGCPTSGLTATSACTGGLWAPNTGANGTTFQPNLPQTNKVDNGVGKISYNLNDKNSFSGVFFRGYDQAIYNDTVNQSRAQWESLTTVAATMIAGGWTFTPNSTWVNEFHAGWAHYWQKFDSADIGIPITNYVSPSDGKNYSLSTGVVDNPSLVTSGYRADTFSGFPTVSLNGFTLQLGTGWPKYIGPDNNLQFADHISYLRGQHAFKFGAEMNRASFSGAATSNGRATIPFGASGPTALTDYFTGVLNGSGATVLSSNPFRTFHNWLTGAFVQDDWRVKRTVTVNLGLRYEYATVIRGPLESNFVPNIGPVQVGLGLNQAYKPDKNNISPRLGVAWDIRGNGKTVLRAGGSLIYSQINYISVIGPGNGIGLGTVCTACSSQTLGTGATTPGLGTIAVVQSNVSALNWNSSNCNGAACSGVPTIFPASALGSAAPPICGTGTGSDVSPCSISPGGATDPNIRNPYVTTWNLGIQRAITNKISLDIAYVGTHGTKLLAIEDINQPGLAAGYLGNSANNAAANFLALGAAQRTTLGLSAAQTGALTTLANCIDKTLAAAPSLAAGTLIFANMPGTSTAATNCQPSNTSPVEQVNRPYAANCPAPVGLAAGGATACLPQWRVVNMVTNVSNSNYNALQVALTGRPTHGISFNVAYTYSHALDMGSSNFGLTTIPYNANPKLLTYGPSSFDRRHIFNVSTTYSAPDPKLSNKVAEEFVQGWAFNSVIALRGGTYWSPGSADFSGIGDSTTTGTGAWNFYGNPQDFHISKPQATDFHYFLPGNASVAAASGNPSAFAINHAACAAQAQSLVGPSVPMLNGAAVNAGTAGAVMTPTTGIYSLMNLGCYDNNGSVLIPPAYGTLPMNTRGIFEAAPFRIWDFSATKNTKLTERLSAQFRVEFFNVLNTPTFNAPGANPTRTVVSGTAAPGQFGSPSQTVDVAGQSTVVGSGGPRSFQLGLKLTF